MASSQLAHSASARFGSPVSVRAVRANRSLLCGRTIHAGQDQPLIWTREFKLSCDKPHTASFLICSYSVLCLAVTIAPPNLKAPLYWSICLLPLPFATSTYHVSPGEVYRLRCQDSRDVEDVREGESSCSCIACFVKTKLTRPL